MQTRKGLSRERCVPVSIQDPTDALALGSGIVAIDSKAMTDDFVLSGEFCSEAPRREELIGVVGLQHTSDSKKSFFVDVQPPLAICGLRQYVVKGSRILGQSIGSREIDGDQKTNLKTGCNVLQKRRSRCSLVS